MPIAVAFDEEARLLVLELADRYDVANGYRAHSGRVLRVDPRQPTDRQTLTSGLDYPTALAVAPDGRLYVSSGGAFRGANGQVLQIRRVGPQPTRRAF
jgi:DNA-binding beta-propeller fold protein YncE